MQEPARRSGFAVIKALAVEPGPQALAAFDAEIIARQGMARGVAPPLHGDAFGAFRDCDFVQHAPPAKPRRQCVRDLGERLDRLRPTEQANRAGWREAVLFLTSPRLRAR